MINPEQLFTFADDQSFSENSNGEVQIIWVVPENLPYFEGHFPGNPVLPGVALLDLSQVVIRRTDSRLKGMFLTIKSAKFSEIVRPKDQLSLLLRRNQSNQWVIEFSNQNKVVVSKLVFEVI